MSGPTSVESATVMGSRILDLTIPTRPAMTLIQPVLRNSDGDETERDEARPGWASPCRRGTRRTAERAALWTGTGHYSVCSQTFVVLLRTVLRGVLLAWPPVADPGLAATPAGRSSGRCHRDPERRCREAKPRPRPTRALPGARPPHPSRRRRTWTGTRRGSSPLHRPCCAAGPRGTPRPARRTGPPAPRRPGRDSPERVRRPVREPSSPRRSPPRWTTSEPPASSESSWRFGLMRRGRAASEATSASPLVSMASFTSCSAMRDTRLRTSSIVNSGGMLPLMTTQSPDETLDAMAETSASSSSGASRTPAR